METLSLYKEGISGWMGPPSNCYEVSLPKGCTLTREMAIFLFTGMLSYMPNTSATLSVDDADLSVYDNEDVAPTPPRFVVAKTNNLTDEWGASHGNALVLYSDASYAETYVIKEYLKAQHGMQVSPHAMRASAVAPHTVLLPHLCVFDMRSLRVTRRDLPT